MELVIGLFILLLLFGWGVAGWWRYWRAAQAAATYRRWAEAQTDSMWGAAQAARAELARERQAAEWLAEAEKGWTK